MLVVFRKCHIKVQISANISENSRPLWVSFYTKDSLNSQAHKLHVKTDHFSIKIKQNKDLNVFLSFGQAALPSY